MAELEEVKNIFKMDWNDDLQFSDDLFGSPFSSGSCDAVDLWTLVDTDVESDISDVVQPEQQVRFEASILFFSISNGFLKNFILRFSRHERNGATTFSITTLSITTLRITITRHST